MRRRDYLSGLLFFLATSPVLGAVPTAYADEGKPVSYLHGDGGKAYPVVSLTWGLLAISVAVIVIICALLISGVLAKRARSGQFAPVTRGGNGLSWLVWGTGISTVALFGSLVWTVAVLADINVQPLSRK